MTKVSKIKMTVHPSSVEIKNGLDPTVLTCWIEPEQLTFVTSSRSHTATQHSIQQGSGSPACPYRAADTIIPASPMDSTSESDKTARRVRSIVAEIQENAAALTESEDREGAARKKREHYDRAERREQSEQRKIQKRIESKLAEIYFWCGELEEENQALSRDETSVRVTNERHSELEECERECRRLKEVIADHSETIEQLTEKVDALDEELKETKEELDCADEELKQLRPPPPVFLNATEYLAQSELDGRPKKPPKELASAASESDDRKPAARASATPSTAAPSPSIASLPAVIGSRPVYPHASAAKSPRGRPRRPKVGDQVLINTSVPKPNGRPGKRLDVYGFVTKCAGDRVYFTTYSGIDAYKDYRSLRLLRRDELARFDRIGEPHAPLPKFLPSDY